MTAYSDARAISSATFSMWVREVARATGTTVRGVRFGAAVSGVLALGLGAMLALVAGAQLDTEIPVELRAAVLRTSFSGAALTAGAIGVVVCLSMPPRTALQNLADLLPVSRVAARLGQIAPLYVAGLAYSLSLSVTGAVVVMKTSPEVVGVVGGLIVFLALVCVSLTVSIALYMVGYYFAVRWLKLPSHYAATIGGAIALGITLASTVPDILTSQPVLEFRWDIGELLPSRTFAWAADGQLWAMLVAVGWIALASCALSLGAGLRIPHARSRQPRWLHGARPLRRSAWWGQVWFETLVFVRNPQFTMTALLLPAAVGAVYSLSLLPVTAPLAGQLGLSVSVFPFMLALYSTGRTLPSAWVGRIAGVATATRIAAKPIAACVASGVLSLCVLAALIILGLAHPAQLPELIARCVLAVGLALTVGSVIPYSEQQPLSIVAGGFILAVLYLLISLGIGLGTQALPATASLAVTTVLALCSLGVYALLSARGHLIGPARA